MGSYLTSMHYYSRPGRGRPVELLVGTFRARIRTLEMLGTGAVGRATWNAGRGGQLGMRAS